MREFVPRATRFVNLPSRFVLKRGGVLNEARIAYEAVGRLNAKRDNAILILTGLSPDTHASAHDEDPTPGWWEPMIGPGRPIDTDRWYVICVNSLGSCKGSTGPASRDPSHGAPYQLTFPELSMEDIADTAAYAVRALGVSQLACVVGTSMGGMSSLALLSRHPGLARNHINISGAVHAQPFSIAIRSLQREAIRVDPNWNMGRYDEERYPKSGMVLARKLGFITYRSAQEWNGRFGRASLDQQPLHRSNHFGPEFAVEGYLDCHAKRFFQSFDPNCYLYLSRCIDRFDLGEAYNGSADIALANVRLDKALVMGVNTDILFPLTQQRQIADGLKVSGVQVTFVALDSQAGHDAFLADTDRFGPPVAEFLSTI